METLVAPALLLTVNNNEYISNLVFGIHYDNLYENTNCTQTNFHPGWAFAYPIINLDLYTGDTLTFELNTTFNWDCVAYYSILKVNVGN